MLGFTGSERANLVGPKDALDCSPKTNRRGDGYAASAPRLDRDAPDLGDFLLQVGEHRVERLTVHLRLELVLVLECDSSLGSRARADLIDEPLKIF